MDFHGAARFVASRFLRQLKLFGVLPLIDVYH
jgi:hypothetical protein